MYYIEKFDSGSFLNSGNVGYIYNIYMPYRELNKYLNQTALKDSDKIEIVNMCSYRILFKTEFKESSNLIGLNKVVMH